jgi:drug/metabolite transporter (DMT)-like permease
LAVPFAQLMIQNKQPAPIPILLAFASTYILWGTTYFAVLVGLQTLPPFVMGAFRFLLAGIILFMILFFNGQALWKKGMFQNILLGMVILSGGQGLLFWSEQYIPSGYTAILVSTLPLWYVLLDSKNRGMYFKNKIVLAGLILGFFGILLLFEKYIGTSSGITDMQLLGMLSVFGACICWVTGTLYYKDHVDQNFIFLNLAWQLMGGFLSSLIIAFISGEFFGFSLSKVSTHSWLATVYLAVAGSLVAFIAFTWLLSVRPAAVVGTYAYVNPVIAVLIGWMLANESISVLQIAGMIIILISAALVNSTKYKWNNKKNF